MGEKRFNMAANLILRTFCKDLKSKSIFARSITPRYCPCSPSAADPWTTNRPKPPGGNNENTLTAYPSRVRNWLCFADLRPTRKIRFLTTRVTVTSKQSKSKRGLFRLFVVNAADFQGARSPSAIAARSFGGPLTHRLAMPRGR
jgi:hypothetical protein